MSLAVLPATRPKIIPARSTCRKGAVRDLTKPFSVSRSPSLNAITIGRGFDGIRILPRHPAREGVYRIERNLHMVNQIDLFTVFCLLIINSESVYYFGVQGLAVNAAEVLAKP